MFEPTLARVNRTNKVYYMTLYVNRDNTCEFERAQMAPRMTPV